MVHEFAQYQQSAEILERMREVPLIGVVGPTNVGKTTLMEHAHTHDPSLHLVVSDTSRPPRDHEVDGQHYYFRSLPKMQQLVTIGGYATVAPSSTGDLYATAPDEYDQFGRPMMAILSSAMPMFRQVFPRMSTIVIVPPDYATWMGRMTDRNKRQARMTEAIESLRFAAQDAGARYVINGDITVAQNDFNALVAGNMTPRLEVRQQQAKHIASQILRQIK